MIKRSFNMFSPPIRLILLKSIKVMNTKYPGEVYFSYQHNTRRLMNSTGPAICGGCVTRRSTGQCHGTLARKLSRCTILFACRCAHPERSEGRVQEPLLICLGSRSKSKNCDEQLTHIVRVRQCTFINYYKLIWLIKILMFTFLILRK